MTDLHDEYKKILNNTLADKGLAPGALQWKWRNNPPPFPGIPKESPSPENDAYVDWFHEGELALLDAFVNCGGATAWHGDGSSCAAQILEAVAGLREKQ